MSQSGAKEAPLSVSDPLATQRNWTWPYWDISSLYFLSHTALGEAAYVETKAYYNTFEQRAGFLRQRQLQRADFAAGLSQLLRRSRLWRQHRGRVCAFCGRHAESVSIFYRRDAHDEWQTVYSPRTFTEPHQANGGRHLVAGGGKYLARHARFGCGDGGQL
jgi:iron complex outermembrane receptor protein